MERGLQTIPEAILAAALMRLSKTVQKDGMAGLSNLAYSEEPEKDETDKHTRELAWKLVCG